MNIRNVFYRKKISSPIQEDLENGNTRSQAQGAKRVVILSDKDAVQGARYLTALRQISNLEIYLIEGESKRSLWQRAEDYLKKFGIRSLIEFAISRRKQFKKVKEAGVWDGVY